MRKPTFWPAWYYSPDGVGKVFERIQDVPYGWVKRPPLKFVPAKPYVVDKEKTIQALEKLGVTIDPRWGAAHLKKVLDDRSTPR